MKTIATKDRLAAFNDKYIWRQDPDNTPYTANLYQEITALQAAKGLTDRDETKIELEELLAKLEVEEAELREIQAGLAVDEEEVAFMALFLDDEGKKHLDNIMAAYIRHSSSGAGQD
jgi:hypothetical protein